MTAFAIAGALAILACGCSGLKDGLAMLGCQGRSEAVGLSSLTPAQTCVARQVGIRISTDRFGHQSRSFRGCDVFAILTSSEAIRLYLHRGAKNIAKDATQTVGIKTRRLCVPIITAALTKLEKLP